MKLDFNNLKSDEFRNLLKRKEEQIILKAKDGFQDNDNFKRFHRLLVTYKSERSIVSFTSVLMSKSDLLNLPSNFKEQLFDTLDSHEAQTHNFLILDSNLDIKSSERKILGDNNNARKFHCELSEDFCVFLITPQSVNYFVDGYDNGDAIFFSPVEFKNWNELKDVSKILEIFEDYKEHLNLRPSYSNFFVSKSGVKSLHKHLVENKKTQESQDEFLKSHSQLLENKPEDKFREDLRFFLKRKMKGTLIGKEYILDNFKRLDIFINDDLGELYLIEVKWVGVSIHAEGNKVCTSYGEKDINPAAIKQSVNYIKQLNNTGQNLKIAYLVVFDARNDDLPDTCANFDGNQILKDEIKYYKRFMKIPDFRVKNHHPS